MQDLVPLRYLTDKELTRLGENRRLRSLGCKVEPIDLSAARRRMAADPFRELAVIADATEVRAAPSPVASSPPATANARPRPATRTQRDEDSLRDKIRDAKMLGVLDGQAGLKPHPDTRFPAATRRRVYAAYIAGHTQGRGEAPH